MAKIIYKSNDKIYNIFVTQESIDSLPENGKEIIYQDLNVKFLVKIKKNLKITLDLLNANIKKIFTKIKFPHEIIYYIEHVEDYYNVIYNFGFENDDTKKKFIYFFNITNIEFDIPQEFQHKKVTIHNILGVYCNNIPLLSKDMINLLYKETIQDSQFGTVVRKKSEKGVLYIVHGKGFQIAKFGYWTSTIEKLRTRYITVYGHDIQLQTFECLNPSQIEKNVLLIMRKQNLITSGELLSIDSIDECIKHIHYLLQEKNNIKTYANQFAESESEILLKNYMQKNNFNEDSKLCLIKHNQINPKFINYVNNIIYEQSDNENNMKKIIIKLCNILEIQNSYDNKTIFTIDKLLNAYKFYLNLPDNEKVFKVATKANNIDLQAKYTIKSIFEKWSGFTIKKEIVEKVRVKGGRIMIYKYLLKPIDSHLNIFCKN